MAHAFSSLDELGDGPGFRKVAPRARDHGVRRQRRSSTRPGFPGSATTTTRRTSSTSSTAAPRRSRSTARSASSGRAVSSTPSRRRPREIANVGDDDLVLLVIGGKDGYVERDGHVTSDEDLAAARQPRKANSSEGPDDGLPADAADDPASARRPTSRRPGDRHRACRTRASTATRTPTSAAAREAARRGAAEPRPRARRPRRDARAGTTTSTSRRTSASRAAASCCTRSTSACTRTTSATSRIARGRQGGDRRQSRCCRCVEQFHDKTEIEHVFVVEDSYEELLAGADPGRLRAIPELDEDDGARRCVTRAARPGCRRASSTRTARRSCTRSASRRAQPARARVSPRQRRAPAGRADVPRERLGLSVTSPRWSARSSSSQARTSTRRVAARRLRAGRRDDRRPACRRSGWASSACSTRSPDRWDLSRMKGMLVGGSAAPRAMIAGFKQRHGMTVVPRLGDDRDLAGRVDVPSCRGELAERRRGDAVRRTSRCRACRSRSSSCARATTTASEISRGTARRWASSRCRGPWVAAGYYDDARAGRPLDRRRLVQDGRHRLDRTRAGFIDDQATARRT